MYVVYLCIFGYVNKRKGIKFLSLCIYICIYFNKYFNNSDKYDKYLKSR